jgi:hypothetical protein
VERKEEVRTSSGDRFKHFRVCIDTMYVENANTIQSAIKPRRVQVYLPVSKPHTASVCNSLDLPPHPAFHLLDLQVVDVISRDVLRFHLSGKNFWSDGSVRRNRNRVRYGGMGVGFLV